MRVTQRQLDAYDYFVAAGLTEKGAAAVVGNLCQESGEDLNSAMFRAHPDASGGVPQALKSGGIAEWLGSRKTDYIRFSRELALRKGLDQDALLNDLETQCAFVIHELREPGYAVLYSQLTTDTGRRITTLTANFMNVYERPKAGPTAGLDNRISHAEAVYERAQLIKAAEGQPTPIPMPQTAPTEPVPQVLIPQAPLPAPTVPAGPLISAHIAGRQIAILDNLQEMRATIVAERDAYLVSTAMMLAKVDKSIMDIEDLDPVPATNAIAAPLSLLKPSEPQVTSPAITPQKRTQTMFGKSWITSVFGVGSIGGAFATIFIDIANKQMPDAASISLVISSLSAGVGLLNAKDKNVTGGTISAATGIVTTQPVSVVDEKVGNSQRRQDFGR